MNVSRDKDIAYMKELERSDPQRFHRLQRNILKDYARALKEIQQREKLESPLKLRDAKKRIPSQYSALSLAKNLIRATNSLIPLSPVNISNIWITTRDLNRESCSERADLSGSSAYIHI